MGDTGILNFLILTPWNIQITFPVLHYACHEYVQTGHRKVEKHLTINTKHRQHKDIWQYICHFGKYFLFSFYKILTK